jgi:Transglycosylase-like domain
VALPTTAVAIAETESASGPDGFVPPLIQPDDHLKRTYLRLFRDVERKRVADPGRNILLHGVTTEDGEVRSPSEAEIGRSVAVLRRMLRPTERPSDEGGGRGPEAGALRSIAACESGGDPTAVGGGGAYRGKYQFSYGTWQSVGGSGDPAAAPEAEQDRRAAMLLARDGPGHWANCAG